MISQTIFLTSSAGFVSGITHHSVHNIKEKMETRRPSNPQERALVLQAEAAIRRLSAAVTGCGIQGTLSLVLPHCLVGLSINGVETRYRAKQLKAIRKEAAKLGMYGLARSMSKRNIVCQMVAGAAIKGTSTVLLMGTEFDTWLANMDFMSDSLTTAAAEVSVAAPEKVGEDGLKALMGMPVEAVKEAGGDFDGEDIVWHDHKPVGEILGVGMTTGAIERGGGVVIEVPLQKIAGKATGTR